MSKIHKFSEFSENVQFLNKKWLSNDQFSARLTIFVDVCKFLQISRKFRAQNFRICIFFKNAKKCEKSHVKLRTRLIFSEKSAKFFVKNFRQKITKKSTNFQKIFRTKNPKFFGMNKHCFSTFSEKQGARKFPKIQKFYPSFYTKIFHEISCFLKNFTVKSRLNFVILLLVFLQKFYKIFLKFWKNFSEKNFFSEIFFPKIFFTKF